MYLSSLSLRSSVHSDIGGIFRADKAGVGSVALCPPRTMAHGGGIIRNRWFLDRKERGETKRQRERLAEVACIVPRPRETKDKLDRLEDTIHAKSTFVYSSYRLLPSLPSLADHRCVLFCLTHLVPRWRDRVPSAHRRVPRPSAFRDPSPILWAQSTPLRVSLRGRGGEDGFPSEIQFCHFE